jgi:tetratricopeptide (TPR) repeat protein
VFWPFVAVTGQYLFERQAVTIFCGIGFLASVGLLRALWRRYFAEVGVGVVAACALALGLASGVPALLPGSDVYEVAISCGYMLTMLTLGAIWCAIHEPERRGWWLAAASVAYGLAVGARPSLLFGAVVLLVPVAQAWRERRPIGGVLAAVLGPITLVGLGLMHYNFLRFDNPLEFGLHYQLSAKRLIAQQFFSLRYLWFNFRVYFLEPARWRSPFPFVHGISVPPLPAGYCDASEPFGVLTNIPLVWLALAAPLAWRGRAGRAWSVLRWFVMAVVLFFAVCALTVGLFWSAAIRYEMEFLPALVLLAVVGILGLEHALAPTSESGLAGRPFWRRAVRWGWGVLLGISVVFNLLVGAEIWAYAGCALGTVLADGGRVSEGVEVLQKSLRIKPDYADGQQALGTALLLADRAEDAIGPLREAVRLQPDFAEAEYNLGVALGRAGRGREAIQHCEQAVRLKPDFAEAHNGLGLALMEAGNLPAAIGQYEQAVRLKPDFAKAQYNLGIALLRLGKVPEAAEHWEQALRIKPDYAEAHNNLGSALLQAGKVPEAIGQYEQAVRLKPDYAEAEYNLGAAFSQIGRFQEAAGHYEQAVRLKPDYVEAHNNLGLVLLQLGRVQEAAEHWEQALRINPDLADAHCNLGFALEKLGRRQEAVQHYEQALRLKPDLVQAQNNLARARAGQ